MQDALKRTAARGRVVVCVSLFDELAKYTTGCVPLAHQLQGFAIPLHVHMGSLVPVDMVATLYPIGTV